MGEAVPQLLLVAALVIVNAVLAGSEIALISLRESQLARMERAGRAGAVVARLARDPNRFLATIQVGITLSGFLASATAAVTLAEPLIPMFAPLGDSAETVAIVVVTLVLSFFTLVFGELAPKRLALQRSERWALLAGRPLQLLAVVSKPVIWLLGISTNAVVRVLGGQPGSTREEVDLEELREMIVANRSLREDHQQVLVGAFEVAERTVGEVMTPRRNVFTIPMGTPASEAIRLLVAAGHTRAPLVAGGLDNARGVVSLTDLVAVDGASPAERHLIEPLLFPDSVPVLTALRRLQEERQQMALVVDEFGGIDGIVTVEDLVEELVGEIYDESDRDVTGAVRHADGSITVRGRYPVHDLVDLGISVPEGDYRTVGGLIIDVLGRLPSPGDVVVVEEWRVRVEQMEDRSITKARFERLPAPSPTAD